MAMIKRLGVLVLLLSLLIPAAVFSHSGDGDIPEIRASACTGNDGPVIIAGSVDDPDPEWILIMNWIVETLSILP